MTYWGVAIGEELIGSGFDTRRNSPEGDLVPIMFRTRKQARAWIEERFGYLRERPDLTRPPFSWKMPRPVLVQVVRVSKDRK